MKIWIKTKPLRLVLRWIQGLLFAGAILMLGYCGFVLVDTWIFQKQESAALERFVPKEPAASGVSVPEAIGPDGLIGRIGIPRLDISAVVIEGTSHKTLRRVSIPCSIDQGGEPGQRGGVESRRK